ncbi:MAG: DNA gyrase inhibitor YacG [Gammaproteobacteria bacterium]
MNSAKHVPCPTCKASAEFSDKNAFRPFCSERCQLIDLGEWFGEEHRIPGDDVTKSPEQF